MLDISQNGVATCLWYDGVFSDDFIINSLLIVRERILKIGHHSAKLQQD